MRRFVITFLALVMMAARSLWICGLLLLVLAFLGSLTGCGGGGTDEAPVLLATTSGQAQGGNAQQATAVVAAPLLGPTISLDEPATVLVVAHTTWVQQFLGTAELALSVTPGTASTAPDTEHSAGLGQAPASTFSATTTWCAHLPAGQHALQAVARLRATNSAGLPSAVLGAFTAQVQWHVSTIGAAACVGTGSTQGQQ